MEAYTAKPLSPVRKIIAKRMLEATQSIPHFRATADLEVDSLLAHRESLQLRHPEEKLSLNDLMIKACASALMDTPAINIQFVDGDIHYYATADISVVIALNEGLSTPIIRGANAKTVWEISSELKALAARAAHQNLNMDEVFGGSFTLSNLGMYGVDQFDAIINMPQCAILAIGSARPKVLATQEGQLRVATVMNVTLSADHRTVDGVVSAKFLSALRRHVEHPKG